MKVEFDEKKHQYKIDGVIVPGVSNILGQDPEIFKTAARRKGLPENYYAERGNKIHELTYKIDKQIEYSVKEESGLSGYIEAWLMFKTDNHVKIIERELIVASEILMLAGKLDVLCKFNNSIWIIDIKAGAWTEYHQIQVSAYKKLYDDDTRIKKDRSIIKLGGVYLKPNGKYNFREFDYDPFEVVYLRKKYEK